MSKTIMILATNGFEQSELLKPKEILEQAGFTTHVVSLAPGAIKGWNEDDWGQSVTVDKTLDEVQPDRYDALLLPGGQINPDKLRGETEVVELVKTFAASGKPVAAICHAPWLLIEADLVRGRTVTGYKTIRTDLKNAGANVVDKEVAQDGNLITSRQPDDIPAFSQALIAMLQDAKVAENA